MEERANRALKPYLEGGSPDRSTTKFLQALGGRRAESVRSEEYLRARTSGLNMAEAQCAVVICEEMQRVGLEAFISKLESSSMAQIAQKLKRKRRKNQDDTQMKKKSKF